MHLERRAGARAGAVELEEAWSVVAVAVVAAVAAVGVVVVAAL